MAMKYVSAYLMSVLSGNESPSSSDVEKILSTVGVEVEADVLTTFMKSVQGKKSHEVSAGSCVLRRRALLFRALSADFGFAHLSASRRVVSWVWDYVRVSTSVGATRVSAIIATL